MGILDNFSQRGPHGRLHCRGSHRPVHTEPEKIPAVVIQDVEMSNGSTLLRDANGASTNSHTPDGVKKVQAATIAWSKQALVLSYGM